MNYEFVALYRNDSGQTIEFPLVRDGQGSYRLSTTDGLRPVRWWVDDLEFQQYQPADPHRDAQFMNQILTVPIKKPRPAEARSNAA